MPRARVTCFASPLALRLVCLPGGTTLALRPYSSSRQMCLGSPYDVLLLSELMPRLGGAGVQGSCGLSCICALIWPVFASGLSLCWTPDNRVTVWLQMLAHGNAKRRHASCRPPAWGAVSGYAVPDKGRKSWNRRLRMARAPRQDTGKPGIKEVAAVAGVSPTTVSRVMNDRGYISQATRDKVHAAMKQIGYAANDVARAMLSGSLNLIGIIVPHVISPFHGQVVQAAERVLADNGYKLMLCNSANRPERERAYVDMLRRNMVDGIIVSSLNPGIHEYAESGLALVGLDCDLGADAVQVASDNERIGEIATNSLLEGGCRRILCIRNNSRMKMPANRRSETYRRIMVEHGLEPLVGEIEFVKTAEEKLRLVGEMLDAHPDVDGIFAGDDTMASFRSTSVAPMGETCVPWRSTISTTCGFTPTPPCSRSSPTGARRSSPRASMRPSWPASSACPTCPPRSRTTRSAASRFGASQPGGVPGVLSEQQDDALGRPPGRGVVLLREPSGPRTVSPRCGGRSLRKARKGRPCRPGRSRHHLRCRICRRS